MLEVGVSGVHLAVPIFKAQTVGVLAIYSGVTTTRAVATEANAEAVVDSVAYLTIPHALLWVASAFFSDSIAD